MSGPGEQLDPSGLARSLLRAVSAARPIEWNVMARVVLYAAGVVILLPLGLGVLGSVLGDLGMLVDAWGLWGVPLFVAVPVTVYVGGSLIGDRY